MKRLLSALLAVSISTFLVTTPAVSAVKSGATCAKIRTKQTLGNKTFICVKTGKRLIWKVLAVKPSTEVIAPKPLPSPSTEASKPVEVIEYPVETMMPWATTITTESLIKTAESKFNIWWNIHSSAASEFNFYKNPIFDAVNTDWIEVSSRLAAEKFHYIRSTPFNVILSDTDSWAISIMEKQNIPVPPSRYPCNFPAPAQCSDTRNSFFLIVPTVPTVGRAAADQFIPPAHEYFHLVQGQLIQPQRIREDASLPAWFVEGSANFVGYQIIEKAAVATYRSGRTLEINRFYSLQPHAPLSAFIENNMNLNKGLPAGSNPYGIGMVACEYIVASSGFDALLGVFTEMSRGLAFDSAFEKSVGIPLSDFYSKFEQIRDAAGIPQGL